MIGADVVEEHAKARGLTQEDIDGFIAAGVPQPALTRTWFQDISFIGRERVAFDGQGRFEFERYRPEGAFNAYTLLAFNEDGDPADIFAWRPGHRALWLDAIDALGAEQAFLPRLDGTAIDVWPDVLDWLAAERNGLVILNPRRAFTSLRLASPLRVQSVEHGRQLRTILGACMPEIMVAAAQKAA